MYCTVKKEMGFFSDKMQNIYFVCSCFLCVYISEIWIGTILQQIYYFGNENTFMCFYNEPNLIRKLFQFSNLRNNQNYVKSTVFWQPFWNVKKIHLFCWIVVNIFPQSTVILYGPHEGKPTTAHLQITFNSFGLPVQPWNPYSSYIYGPHVGKPTKPSHGTHINLIWAQYGQTPLKAQPWNPY